MSKCINTKNWPKKTKNVPTSIKINISGETFFTVIFGENKLLDLDLVFSETIISIIKTIYIRML